MDVTKKRLSGGKETEMLRCTEQDRISPGGCQDSGGQDLAPLPPIRRFTVTHCDSLHVTCRTDPRWRLKC
ncbi:hypothetical protein GDO81_016741 [Engystomops pustulosus]|uniref:Uncharacterized protein n=1 Tax=Engystomops pustulosus TaxID=76066 RepID=A0AAV7A8B3_ENGPU|nr:hypothetical protein GDO81_016741 [Engystomops pustulosus]